MLILATSKLILKMETLILDLSLNVKGMILVWTGISVYNYKVDELIVIFN